MILAKYLTLFSARAEDLKDLVNDTPRALPVVGATARARGWIRATTDDMVQGREKIGEGLSKMR